MELSKILGVHVTLVVPCTLLLDEVLDGVAGSDSGRPRSVRPRCGVLARAQAAAHPPCGTGDRTRARGHRGVTEPRGVLLRLQSQASDTAHTLTPHI